MSSEKLRRPSVLILGDINVDLLARLETFTGLGGDNLAAELEFHCGGVGANTAVALAKWGVSVCLMGCTGRDCFGDFALRTLHGQGIDVSFVQQTNHALTGLMFIAISPDGQRTIFGSRGANAELPAPAGTWSCLEGIRAVHLVGYNFLSHSVAEVARRLLKEAHKRRAWVSLDVGRAPSHQIPQTILQVAQKVDILFVTLEEAVALTGKRESVNVCAALEQCGIREFVLKLGEQGCLLVENDKFQAVPGFSVFPADTTGAGDAFAAAFLRARLHGWAKAEAALVANAAGAAATTVVGAGERMPAPKQILRLVAASCLAAEWEPVRIRALERVRQELSPADSADSL